MSHPANQPRAAMLAQVLPLTSTQLFPGGQWLVTGPQVKFLDKGRQSLRHQSALRLMPMN